MTPQPPPSPARPLRPGLKRRPVLLGGAALLLFAGALALSFAYFHDPSPKPPDVSKMDLHAAMAFEASPDYLRLSERRRRQFSEAVLQRLRELPFEDLLRTALDPNNLPLHRRRLAHLQTLPNFDALHSQMAADFLEKFYKLPEYKRTIYLTTFAFYQELEARLDPRKYQTPAPDQFHADAVRLFSNQPPRMKAYGMQFFLDLQHQRKRLGLPDRAMPMR